MVSPLMQHLQGLAHLQGQAYNCQWQQGRHQPGQRGFMACRALGLVVILEPFNQLIAQAGNSRRLLTSHHRLRACILPYRPEMLQWTEAFHCQSNTCKSRSRFRIRRFPFNIFRLQLSNKRHLRWGASSVQGCQRRPMRLAHPAGIFHRRRQPGSMAHTTGGWSRWTKSHHLHDTWADILSRIPVACRHSALLSLVEAPQPQTCRCKLPAPPPHSTRAHCHRARRCMSSRKVSGIRSIR